MNTLLLCVEWGGGRHGFYLQPIHSNFAFYLLTIGNLIFPPPFLCLGCLISFAYLNRGLTP